MSASSSSSNLLTVSSTVNQVTRLTNIINIPISASHAHAILHIFYRCCIDIALLGSPSAVHPVRAVPGLGGKLKLQPPEDLLPVSLSC